MLFHNKCDLLFHFSVVYSETFFVFQSFSLLGRLLIESPLEQLHENKIEVVDHFSPIPRLQTVWNEIFISGRCKYYIIMECRVHSYKSFTQGGRSGHTINQTYKLHDPPSIVLMQRYQIYLFYLQPVMMRSFKVIRMMEILVQKIFQ